MSRNTENPFYDEIVSKFHQFNQQWFESKKLGFRNYNSLYGKFNTELDEIEFFEFQADRIPEELSHEEVNALVKDHQSYLYEVFQIDFIQYCWNSNFENDKKDDSFSKLTIPFKQYFKLEHNKMGDFYLHSRLENDISHLIETIKNSIPENIDSNKSEEVMLENTTLEKNSYWNGLSSDNKSVCNNLINWLKVEVINEFGERMNLIRSVLAHQNSGSSLEETMLYKFEDICKTKYVFKQPLCSWFEKKGDETPGQVLLSILAGDNKSKSQFYIYEETNKVYKFLTALGKLVNINFKSLSGAFCINDKPFKYTSYRKWKSENNVNVVSCMTDFPI